MAEQTDTQPDNSESDTLVPNSSSQTLAQDNQPKPDDEWTIISQADTIRAGLSHKCMEGISATADDPKGSILDEWIRTTEFHPDEKLSKEDTVDN